MTSCHSRNGRRRSPPAFREWTKAFIKISHATTVFFIWIFTVLLAGCSSESTTGSTTSTSADGPGSAETEEALQTNTDPVANSDCGIPAGFHWKSSGPLIGPQSDSDRDLVSIKDPTVVFFNGRWHIYATTANTAENWSLVYLNFTDWDEAAYASQHYLDTTPAPALSGYKAAPQLFYFHPQDKWYLIYQAGPPQYSTADDPAEWQTWTQPRNFFEIEPDIVAQNKGAGGWLDFFVICDEKHCYLFFTDDNGHLYRARTSIEDFPDGFGDTVLALSDTRDNLFEGSAHYKIKGMDKYLTLIEAFGPTGRRYYRAWVADRLDGAWTPLAATWENPFAAMTNVAFPPTESYNLDISHGELIRDGYDERMTVDTCRLQFLYQSMDLTASAGLAYSQLPYRLGLLTLQQETGQPQ